MSELKNITHSFIQKIIDKPTSLPMKRMDIINPQQLVSGVSSAANPRDGRTIKIEEFEDRLGGVDANAQERSLLEIPPNDRKLLFIYLKQQHQSNPTIATTAQLQSAASDIFASAAMPNRAESLIKAFEIAKKNGRSSTSAISLIEDGLRLEGRIPEGKRLKEYVEEASSEASKEQKQEIQGLIKELKIKFKGGGSRKKKSTRRRNKTSRRRC